MALEDVRGNCFCASLLRTTRHDRAPSLIGVIGLMAIAIALPGFNDPGRFFNPYFFLMKHFLYLFPTFSEKMKKIYRLEV